jgi:hypothetical protein
MKRIACIAALVLSATNAFADPLPVPPRPLQPGPTLPIPHPPGPLFTCPDPSAARMDLAVVRRDPSGWSGRVRITGVVKNVGSAPYVSGANQQIVSIYQVQNNHNVLVATRAFGNLAVGEETTIVFETEWYAPNEFPPSFRMMIVYDPDIRLDGNPKNDDCKMSNNTRERTGAEISALFAH